jgi:hypothetical protein
LSNQNTLEQSSDSEFEREATFIGKTFEPCSELYLRADVHKECERFRDEATSPETMYWGLKLGNKIYVGQELYETLDGARSWVKSTACPSGVLLAVMYLVGDDGEWRWFVGGWCESDY